jgi:hypothetical protein
LPGPQVQVQGHIHRPAALPVPSHTLMRASLLLQVSLGKGEEGTVEEHWFASWGPRRGTWRRNEAGGWTRPPHACASWALDEPGVTKTVP